jgi:hypothetical protein
MQLKNRSTNDGMVQESLPILARKAVKISVDKGNAVLNLQHNQLKNLTF